MFNIAIISLIPNIMKTQTYLEIPFTDFNFARFS